VAALRSGGGQTHSAAAHATDAAAGAIRTSVVQVRRGQCTWGFAAIDAGNKKRGGAFENWKRGAAQQIREADEDNVLAAADGEDEAGVGVKLDAKARGTAVAIEPGKDALEERGASGNLRTL